MFFFLTTFIRCAKITMFEQSDKIGGQLESLLTEIRATNRHAAQILKKPELDAMLSDASAAFAAARRIAESSEEPFSKLLASARQVSEALVPLRETLDSFSGEAPETLSRLRRTLRLLEEVISENQQDIDAVVENLRVVSENFRELSEEAKEYPSQFLFGRPPAPSNPWESP